MNTQEQRQDDLVQVFYWPPGKHKNSYGHVALNITYWDSETSSMQTKYISFVPDRENNNGYKIISNYNDDKRIMGGKFHSDCVDLRGLNISKMLKKQEEYVQRGDMTYGTVSLFRILIAGEGLMDGNESDGVARVWKEGNTNCTIYAHMLLSEGGLKTPGLMPSGFFGCCLMLFPQLIILSGVKKLKFDDADKIYVSLGFLCMGLVSLLGFLSCLYRSALGAGAIKTPTGLYNLAIKNRDKTTDSCISKFFTCDSLLVSIPFAIYTITMIIYFVSSLANLNIDDRKNMMNVSAGSLLFSGVAQSFRLSTNSFCSFFKSDKEQRGETPTTNQPLIVDERGIVHSGYTNTSLAIS